MGLERDKESIGVGFREWPTYNFEWVSKTVTDKNKVASVIYKETKE